MRLLYLIGSIIFTVVILIISFENFQATCTYINIFFTEIPSSTSPTFVFFGVAALGIFTGMCYQGLLTSLLANNTEDEDEPEDW